MGDEHRRRSRLEVPPIASAQPRDSRTRRRPGKSTPDSAPGAWFLNEARASIIAQHPGLVKIFDSGQLADGTLYILMEFLEGETVASRLGGQTRRPLAEAITVRLGRQIASALAVAHARGIAHRGLFIPSTGRSWGFQRRALLSPGAGKRAARSRGQPRDAALFDRPESSAAAQTARR